MRGVERDKGGGELIGLSRVENYEGGMNCELRATKGKRLEGCGDEKVKGVEGGDRA